MGDIEKMLREAEEWAEQDKQVKMRVEARNSLEQYSYSLKNQLDDDDDQLGGKLSDEDKQKILDVVNEKLDWLRENEDASAEDFESAKKSIEEVAQPIIASLYSGKTEENSSESNESEEL